MVQKVSILRGIWPVNVRLGLKACQGQIFQLSHGHSFPCPQSIFTDWKMQERQANKTTLVNNTALSFINLL